MFRYLSGTIDLMWSSKVLEMFNGFSFKMLLSHIKWIGWTLNYLTELNRWQSAILGKNIKVNELAPIFSYKIFNSILGRRSAVKFYMSLIKQSHGYSISYKRTLNLFFILSIIEYKTVTFDLRYLILDLF